jgi:Tol biopolymer transport system component
MKTGINGIYFLRLLSVTLMLVLITPFVTEAQTGKVNFTGSWALNAEKSTLGDNPRMGGGNFIAVQEGNLLSVERTRTNRDGETVTTTMKYTLDGKESINTSPRGDSKSVAAWSTDGKTLTINTARTFEMNGETMNIKSVEVWALTDPKIITIQSTSTTPDGERKMTMIYDKK